MQLGKSGENRKSGSCILSCWGGDIFPHLRTWDRNSREYSLCEGVSLFPQNLTGIKFSRKKVGRLCCLGIGNRVLVISVIMFHAL